VTIKWLGQPIKEMGEALERDLNNHKVPEGLHHGLILYLTHGIPPGSFMMAVLGNDLREACRRADLTNKYRLFDIVNFLYNCAPVSSWGSEENVMGWIKWFREKRELENKEEIDNA